MEFAASLYVDSALRDNLFQYPIRGIENSKATPHNCVCGRMGERPAIRPQTHLYGVAFVFTVGPPAFHARLPKADTSRGGYLANRVLRVVDQLSPGARMAAAGFSSQFMEPSSWLGRLCQGSMHTN